MPLAAAPAVDKSNEPKCERGRNAKDWNRDERSVQAKQTGEHKSWEDSQIGCLKRHIGAVTDEK
jgi:hypothetical protein